MIFNQITENSIFLTLIFLVRMVEHSKKTEGCDWGCDWKGEVFLLELTSCTVIENADGLSAAELSALGAHPRDIRECTLIYPSRAFIIVIDADPVPQIESIVVEDTSYQDWLWYVILAAAVVIAGLSYVAYTWYKNKKMKETDVKNIEKDMEDVIEEQEMGWQPTMDDGEIAGPNPLAQIGGVQKPIPSANAQMGLEENEIIKDVAKVAIEKFDERVEYGQQRGGQTGDEVYGANGPSDIL